MCDDQGRRTVESAARKSEGESTSALFIRVCNRIRAPKLQVGTRGEDGEDGLRRAVCPVSEEGSIIDKNTTCAVNRARQSLLEVAAVHSAHIVQPDLLDLPWCQPHVATFRLLHRKAYVVDLERSSPLVCSGEKCVLRVVDVSFGRFVAKCGGIIKKKQAALYCSSRAVS